MLYFPLIWAENSVPIGKAEWNEITGPIGPRGLKPSRLQGATCMHSWVCSSRAYGTLVVCSKHAKRAWVHDTSLTCTNGVCFHLYTFTVYASPVLRPVTLVRGTRSKSAEEVRPSTLRARRGRHTSKWGRSRLRARGVGSSARRGGLGEELARSTDSLAPSSATYTILKGYFTSHNSS